MQQAGYVAEPMWYRLSVEQQHGTKISQPLFHSSLQRAMVLCSCFGGL